MRTYGEKEHIYASTTNISDKQDEIADVLGNVRGYMEMYTLETMTKLAKQYYETDQEIAYGAYTEKNHPEEDDLKVKNKEYLYTLIQYEGKDVLLHIGTWEFTQEVFTRRDIPQLMWLSHSPLPLFVVPARAKKEYPWAEKEWIYKHAVVRRFLDDCAILYSPKWWQAEIRMPKYWWNDIQYGQSNGILHHKDAMFALQEALINKICKEKNEKEKMLKEITDLQKLSKKEFLEWVKGREKYYTDNQRILIDMFEKMIEDDDDQWDESWSHIHDKRMTNIYAMIKTFDVVKLAAK